MKFNKSKGFTLIELTVVMALLGVMMILEIQKKTTEFYQMNARTLGVEIFRYSNGVQDWMSQHSGDTAGVVSRGEDGVKTDLKWLQNSTCGGTASKEFLPCDFLVGSGGKTTFGKLGVTTTISIVSDPNGDIIRAVTVYDELLFDGKPDYSLSGLAALVASGAWSVGQSDPSLFTTDATIKFCVTEAVWPQCLGNLGKIVVLSTTQSKNDRWLRVDHGNNMQNILEFDKTVNGVDKYPGYGFSLRQIKNVARIYNEGVGADLNGDGVPDDPLFLGKNNGTLPASLSTAGVVVDADQVVLGKLNALGDIQAEGGDIIAKKGVNSLGVTGGGNITGDENLKIGKDATIDGMATIGKDLLVGDPASGGSIHARILGSTFDRSTLAPGDIRADLNALIGNDAIIGHDATIENDLLVKGVVSSGRVDKFIRGTGLADEDDNTYFVDPDSDSNFNTMHAHSLTASVTPGDPEAGTLNLGANTLRFRQPTDTGSMESLTNLSGFVDVTKLNVQMDSGAKVPLSHLLPKMVPIDSYVVLDGDVVPYPVCATGGLPKIILTPQTAEVLSIMPSDLANGSAYASWTTYATNNGGGWLVTAKSYDPFSGGESCTASGGDCNSVVAQTFCAY